ncbi:regulator of nonsense transcripts 3A-like [Paramacrobiotus metropolitanus]|uniref:regulator of nonsense transcripts 3A-like n=1 Tax=Paramacrobiotus metropolitanus TaxID=2943436 RepID=UPI002445F0B0|nr:regulator of nonsense transcripts 3A-like [Paramacrobiotus metropolitanus]
MSFVVRASGKTRRGHDKDEFVRERRGKPKAKPRYREFPEERHTQPCKVIVRNLPAHFSKEQFLQHVSPIPEYTYFAFHGPDTTLANHARCRVYIRFRTEEDVGLFKEKFDGYVFVDSRGHELRCVVELAPYQRTAEQNREKADPKCGQITESDDFKRFLEDLEKKKDHGPSSSAAKVQASLAAIENKPKDEVTLTPLMEYLQNHKADDDYRGPGGRFGKRERNRERHRANAALAKKEAEKAAAKARELAGKDSPLKAGAAPSKVMELTKSGVKDSAAAQSPINKVAPGSISHQTAQPASKKDEAFLAVNRRPAQENREDFMPSGDRGRHYFPERPAPRPVADKRAREDHAPSSLADQRREREAKRSDRPDGRGDRQDVYYPRGGRQAESYGGRPPVRPDFPPDSGKNTTRAGAQQSPKPLHNPITGSREFGQSKATEAPVVKSTGTPTGEKNSVVKSGEIGTVVGEVVGGTVTAVDPGVRVPNRSRPTKELYQPKAKRRYQN